MTEDILYYSYPGVRWRITEEGRDYLDTLRNLEEANKDPQYMDPTFRSRLSVICGLEASSVVTEGIIRFFESSTFVRLVPQVIEFLVNNSYIEEDLD